MKENLIPRLEELNHEWERVEELEEQLEEEVAGMDPSCVVFKHKPEQDQGVSTGIMAINFCMNGGDYEHKLYYPGLITLNRDEQEATLTNPVHSESSKSPTASRERMLEFMELVERLSEMMLDGDPMPGDKTTLEEIIKITSSSV